MITLLVQHTVILLTLLRWNIVELAFHRFVCIKRVIIISKKGDIMRKYVVHFEAELISKSTNDHITIIGHTTQRARTDARAHEKAMRALIKRFKALCTTEVYKDFYLSTCETTFSYRLGKGGF